MMVRSSAAHPIKGHVTEQHVQGLMRQRLLCSSKAHYQQRAITATAELM